jgi:hypothetical protein
VPDYVDGVDLVAGSGIAITKALTAGTRGNLAQYQIAAAPGRVFYFASSDASDIAGYKTLLPSPSAAAEQTISVACTGTGDVLVASFATDPGVPGATDFPAGTATRALYAKVNNGTARLHLQVYVRNAAGVETLARDELSPSFSDTAAALQSWVASATSAGTLLATDRLVAKLYAQRVSGPATVTVTTYFEGTAHASQVQTTVPASTGGGGGAPSGPAGGDLTGSYPNPTLAAAGPGATGPVGAASTIPVVTIDAKGRVTALTSVAAAAAAGGATAADTAGWMPLTTVVGGVPDLVWDAADNLIPTFAPF